MCLHKASLDISYQREERTKSVTIIFIFINKRKEKKYKIVASKQEKVKVLDLDNGDLYLTKPHLITRTKNPLINLLMRLIFPQRKLHKNSGTAHDHAVAAHDIL